MALTDLIPSHYIILTPTVPVTPYDLGEGHILRAVKAKDEMFKGFSDFIPHGYGAVMALCNLGTLTYYVYRDLVFFHAFITNDNETYEFGEIAQDKCQENSELTFIERHNATLGPFHPDRINEIDFDQFPLILYWSTEDIIPSIPEPPLTPAEQLILKKEGMLTRNVNPEKRSLNYRNAFNLFRQLKCRTRDEKKLYNQICLYNFAKSIKESRELYHNESAVIAFYMGILQSIAGDPPNCEELPSCNVCGREIPSHHRISREQHMINRFGHGFTEQTKIRGAFFHDGEFVNYTDAMAEVNDRIYLDGERTEENLTQSHELYELKEQVDKLGNTVRKNLAELFLEQYCAQYGEPK